MCEHHLATTDHSSKRRRQLGVLARMAWHERPSSGAAPGPGHYPYRSLCCFLSLAFALGLVLGVMIPLSLLPRHAEASILPARANNFSSRGYARLDPAAFVNQVREEGSGGGLEDRRQWRVTPNGSRSEAPPPVTPPPAPSSTTRFPSVSFVAQFPASPPAMPTLTFNGSVAAMLRGQQRPSHHRSPSTTSTPEDDSDGGLLRGGIYWGRSVEEALPRGFSDAEVEAWRRFTRTTPVVKMEEGCGRMQNRLLTFLDGTTSCCRYRQNTDQIQGELFSFLLGHLLGLRNLAPSALSVVRLRDPRWSQVREHVAVAEWAEDKPVVMTRFVPSLQPTHIPRALRGPNRRLHPPDVLPDSDLSELAQWSDLVVFDYLTANLDRVVNNLYNQQWNKGMMDAPAHNLARDPATGLLVFLDNESGLLHGYRLLRKYESYHRLLLDQLCVFRKPTVDALRDLHRTGDVGDRLHAAFVEGEPHGRDVLPGLPTHNVKVLNERITRVLGQVELCEARYGRRTSRSS